MITKQELIDYLKKQANRYHVDASLPQDDLIYDCSKDLGIPIKNVVVVMFLKESLEIQILTKNYHYETLKNIENFVNDSWDKLETTLKALEDKYYNIRWKAHCSVVGALPGAIGVNGNNLQEIYMQITSEYLRVFKSLSITAKLIGRIEDNIWKLGELLIKKYKYYKDSPIKYIRRIGNKIYLRKKWQDTAEFDALGQMLFSNGFAYIIRDEDFDAFVMTLELIGG